MNSSKVKNAYKKHETRAYTPVAVTSSIMEMLTERLTPMPCKLVKSITESVCAAMAFVRQLMAGVGVHLLPKHLHGSGGERKRK